MRGFKDFQPDACLINRYAPGARLSLHQDRDEHELGAPVVSLSLGDSCLFRIGGTRRSDATRSFRLSSGDALVLAGSDPAAHGVEVWSGEATFELFAADGPADRFAVADHRWKSRARLHSTQGAGGVLRPVSQAARDPFPGDHRCQHHSRPGSDRVLRRRGDPRRRHRHGDRPGRRDRSPPHRDLVADDVPDDEAYDFGKGAERALTSYGVDLSLVRKDIDGATGIAIINVHRNPELYPEPERFRPDRFLGATFPPSVYLPFGGGARRWSCRPRPTTPAWGWRCCVSGGTYASIATSSAGASESDVAVICSFSI